MLSTEILIRVFILKRLIIQLKVQKFWVNYLMKNIQNLIAGKEVQK